MIDFVKYCTMYIINKRSIYDRTAFIHHLSLADYFLIVIGKALLI